MFSACSCSFFRSSGFVSASEWFSDPSTLWTSSSFLRIFCCIQRSLVLKCRTFPRPSRWLMPMAADASLRSTGYKVVVSDTGVDARCLERSASHPVPDSSTKREAFHCFLGRPADGPHLPQGLLWRTWWSQRESCDDIVKRGLKARRCAARPAILKGGKVRLKRQLRCHVGQRIACGFRSQGAACATSARSFFRPTGSE